MPQIHKYRNEEHAVLQLIEHGYAIGYNCSSYFGNNLIFLPRLAIFSGIMNCDNEAVEFLSRFHRFILYRLTSSEQMQKLKDPQSYNIERIRAKHVDVHTEKNTNESGSRRIQS